MADKIQKETKWQDYAKFYMDENKVNLDKFRRTCSCSACQAYKGTKTIVTQEFTRLH